MQKLVIARQFVCAIVATILFNYSTKLKLWNITRNLSKHILSFIHLFTVLAAKLRKNFQIKKSKKPFYIINN